MSLKSFKARLLAASAALFLAAPASADGIMVQDAYARASAMMSTSGAAFMMIHNGTGQDDRLIDVKSDIADRVELHTHQEDANGVMKMVHVKEGFPLPKDGMIAMQRGGNHVMFLGLKQPLKQGEMVPVTLVFEKAGEIAVEVPVDLDRKPIGRMKMDHSRMKMSTD